MSGTEPDLDAIEVIVGRATIGPWSCDESSVRSPGGIPVAISYSGGNSICDADFIAVARSTVPALLAEVRRLREQSEAALGLVEQRDFLWAERKRLQAEVALLREQRSTATAIPCTADPLRAASAYAVGFYEGFADCRSRFRRALGVTE